MRLFGEVILKEDEEEEEEEEEVEEVEEDSCGTDSSTPVSRL